MEKILAAVGYSAYEWFPLPEDSGNKELLVRVKDTSGQVFTSAPVPVTVLGLPRILLEGLGPNQVITGETEIKVLSNIEPESFRIILSDQEKKSSKILAENLPTFSWTPEPEDSGYKLIWAEGYFQGQKITTEEIPVRIYLGKIYTAQPIVAKNEFQSFASVLAKTSSEKTGMSAALQTAQAILETGWGQSVPVDKYTGKFSYNLFGIKGTGPAGSVISNTWEEYNGSIFRIDASFRAYSDAGQSWNDHKALLLNAQRYAQFREVMHNSTQGAWALKRAGYATDSLYPMKLINIIKIYDLQKLDEVSF